MFTKSAALIWVITSAKSGHVICHVTISHKKSLFEPIQASFNSFKCLNNRSFYLLRPCRSYYVDLCQANPLGYTNFKEISETRARPHFNSRHWWKRGWEQNGLKTQEIFKNKHRFKNVRSFLLVCWDRPVSDSSWSTPSRPSSSLFQTKRSQGRSENHFMWDRPLFKYYYYYYYYYYKRLLSRNQ